MHFSAARAGRAPWFLVLAMPYGAIMGSVIRLMSIVTVMELVLLAALAHRFDLPASRPAEGGAA